MIVVASFATLATSEARAELEETATGRAFELSPAIPERTVEASFEANEPALSNTESVYFRVEHRTYWRGVASGVVGELETTMRHLAGPALGSDDAHLLRCFGGSDCLGRYRVTFRWPSEITRGSVEVRWAVVASAQYDDSAPPDGAVIRVQAIPAAHGGGEGIPLAEGRLVVQGAEPTQAVDIMISSLAPIDPAGRLRLETRLPYSDLDQSYAYVALRQGRSLRVLHPPSLTTPLVPASCLTGPCRITMRLFATITGIGDGSAGIIEWKISGLDVGTTLEVETHEGPVPRISSSKELGTIRLRGAGAAETLSLTFSAPATALPPEEFRLPPAATLITIELHPDPPEPAPIEEPLFVDLFISHGRRTARVSSPPYLGEDWRSAQHNPLTFSVPNLCQPARPCQLDLLLTLSTMGDGWKGSSIELHPDLAVSLVYPVSGRQPPGETTLVRVTS